MFNYKKIIRLKLILVFIFFPNIIFADNHNVNEILELIQKDLKTLEKAVYSGSINSNSQTGTNENSEDVLTRHLLKLSDVEKQFQELTNKFEEINFKLDKLSNRLSKVQADNQIRFQDLENTLSSGEIGKKLTSIPKEQVDKTLPGSSQPQDLGSISYKDTETNEFVIDFDNDYTRISSDATSSYFDLYMNGLEPERYYTVLVQTSIGGITKVFDEGIMFKVTKG